MWACINLRETPGGSRHVADQLSELGVRHAATHSVEASRYCGQKLLVPLVIPVMQKALPALRGRSCLRPGSIVQSWHLSVRPTLRSDCFSNRPASTSSSESVRSAREITSAICRTAATSAPKPVVVNT
jgi:hypothetical protein